MFNLNKNILFITYNDEWPALVFKCIRLAHAMFEFETRPRLHA